MDWHGYRQHDDALLQKPWWRKQGTGYIRTDGAAALEWWRRPLGGGFTEGAQRTRAEILAEVARIDREKPLPVPQPLCLQVWVWPETGHKDMVLAMDDTGVYGRLVRFTHGDDVKDSPYTWPPPGAVLVAGPGAPWAPMEAAC